MKASALNIANLRITFGSGAHSSHAVDGASLTIQEGSIHALIGESGCGKSLTALAVLRLLPFPAARISAGSIQLGDTDILALSSREMRHVRKNRVGFIFQEPMTSLNPVLTIRTQLIECLREPKHLSPSKLQHLLEGALDEVGLPHPSKVLEQYPHELSGGMKQRVMIAMALASEPELLIADEPTTALDVTIQAQVLDLLRNLQRARAMSLLFITHDLGVASSLADEISVMYSGHVVEHATTKMFFTTPLHPYSEKLIGSVPDISKRSSSLSIIEGQVPEPKNRPSGCRFAARCSLRMPECLSSDVEMISLDDESKSDSESANSLRQVRCLLYSEDTSPARESISYSAAPKVPGEESKTSDVIAVENLHVHYPLRKKHLLQKPQFFEAVRGVNFSLRAGETLALVGESGCGKTSVALAIARLIPKASGSVLIEGVSLDEIAEKKLRSSVQCIFQDPFNSMNPRLTAAEIIAEPLICNTNMPRRAMKKAVASLLDDVGLPRSSADRYPNEFSGGQRQRIAIARALALQPNLIICDEPTSALDVSVQAQVLNLLKELQKERGMSYLFITHNISVVEYIATDVCVMLGGQIVEQGDVTSLISKPTHEYTAQLLGSVPRFTAPSSQLTAR